MFILNTLMLLIVTTCLYLYWIFKKSYKYFEIHGIPYEKPYLFFGNMKDVYLMKKSLIVLYSEIYEKMEPHKYSGIYAMRSPQILIRDPDLIKQVLVKDFSNFCDRTLDIPTEPFARNIFGLRGDEWKNLRIKLSGTFTSGKMKMMFPLMKKCAEDVIPALNKCLTHSVEGIEMKDFCARYTTDVIGSCAFGVESHSLENPDSEFRKMGKQIFAFRLGAIVRSIFPNFPSILVKWFGLEFFDKNMTDYFTNIIMKMVKFREENNVRRHDFLDQLIALKNNTEIEKFKEQGKDEDLEKFLSQIGDKFVKSKIEMTTEFMAAQCFIFFLAGFEASSSTLSFLLLELAHNQEIQQKVRQEFTALLENSNEELTYDMLKEMTYTNMVLDEILRKYTTAGVVMRTCIQNYRIPETDFVIEKGTQIIISSFGIHKDEKYYEKPNDFHPQHFTEEAKAKRPLYAYLPFGEGPRVCIAERFARMQIKVALVFLITHFAFSAHSKTKLPVEFSPGFGLLNVKEGVWINFHKI